MSPADEQPPCENMALDALVIGGGIAGLWILDTLRKAGRSAVLAEADRLGAGQSICAQGIIHGGLKYALGGVAGRDARQIAAMPETWREALQGGTSKKTLSEAHILNPHTWLWRSDSLRSRVGMLGARLGLQTRPDPVKIDQRPPLLRNAPGTVLRVPEPVVDVRSVLQSLLDAHSQYIIRTDGTEGIELCSKSGRVDTAVLRSNGQQLTVSPEVVILAAGSGNLALRRRLGLEETKMQRRPLHMVILKGELPAFFGHCIDGNRTRITVSSSAADPQGHRAWQIGGELSEGGVHMDEDDLLARAREELHAVLPALQQDGLVFSSYRVDRAEGATGSGRRPEDISIIDDAQGHTLTCWPTKLALAPRLAEAVCHRVPSGHAAPELVQALAPFPRPQVAAYPWEREYISK